MNMAHNGMHLGQALYKVCNHLWFVAKVSTDSMRQILTNQSLQVGHITCDNARNNDTMLEEFVCCYQAKAGSKFDIKCRQIRYFHLDCVAVVLNPQNTGALCTSST